MTTRKGIKIIIAAFVYLFYCGLAYAQLSPPKWTVAIKTEKEVLLTWQMSKGAIKTLVYRKKEGDETFELISDKSLGFYVDKKISAGVYIYRLQVVGVKGGKSDFSDDRFIIVEKAKRLKYTPPKWGESYTSEDSVLLRWYDTSDVPISAYNLYKKIKGEKSFKLFKSEAIKSYMDTSVSLGQNITYKICPVSTDFEELACSLPINLVVKIDAERKKKTRKFDFVVRRSVLDKFLTLPKDKPFVSPTDITVDVLGKIYVADTGTGLIHVFNYSGFYSRSYGAVNLEDGTFKGFENLLGIDVDKEGNIYAVDAYKGIVQVINQKGIKVLTVELQKELKGYKDFKFEKFGLVDVSVDNKKKVIYVVDNYNNVIYKLDKKGNLLKVFSQKGQKPGQIHLPTFSYVDEESNLIISDTMNQRVSVFDSDLKPKMVFGKEGDNLGTFIRPKGIAKDISGDIFIADSFTNTIQVFSPKGGFKYVLGNARGNQPDIATPNGIFVDRRDKIYIVEKFVDRIQVRQLLQLYVTKKTRRKKK